MRSLSTVTYDFVRYGILPSHLQKRLRRLQSDRCHIGKTSRALSPNLIDKPCSLPATATLFLARRTACVTATTAMRRASAGRGLTPRTVGAVWAVLCCRRRSPGRASKASGVSGCGPQPQALQLFRSIVRRPSRKLSVDNRSAPMPRYKSSNSSACCQRNSCLAAGCRRRA
jgi:hypothetical protein